MKQKKVCMLLCAVLLLSVFGVHAYEVNWAEALQKSIYFYDANMCGPDVAENTRLQWRGDCHIWDAVHPHPLGSGTIDVSGGFHDCGDHVKFGQPQVYAIATLGWGYYEFKDAYVETGQQGHLLDVLKWGCDYLLRCTELDGNGSARFFIYMVGKGGSDHVVWIPPELQTQDMDSRPSAWASPETPASEMCGG
ncbi:MAG: glycoside hydrolase family 9 protein, partial [Spirochaetales bacterium]|nr:glycoside hydrolase family 9 protein [Spirochaetales bacterium]